MFIFHPMVSVTVFIVSRGSHWPDAYFSMCDIKSLSIYLSIVLAPVDCMHYMYSIYKQEYIIERGGECRTCSASLRKVIN